MIVGTPVWYLDDGGSGWQRAEVESINDLDLVLKCDNGSRIHRRGKRMSDDRAKFDGVEDAFTSLFQIPKDTVFDMPKDMDKGTTLVWTSQADALTKEVSARKGQKHFSDNFFVLSGPSGIGKTCIALSVALKLKQMGEVVLYVSDAGSLLDRATEGITADVTLTRSILNRLIALFKKQNPNIEINEEHIATQSDLVETLDQLDGVVIIDEQGPAYVKLRNQPLGPSSVFSMITPRPYEIYGKGVRLIITGSNYEAFEVSLNSSYHFCRRYAQPMTDSEVSDMCKLRNLASSLDDLKFYCNNVPREVLGFSRAASPEAYLQSKRQLMFEDVFKNLSKLDDGKKKFVSAMLENLFFDHNLAILAGTIPFFDIGLVYRRPVEQNPNSVFPLCLAAEMALLDLWKVVGPFHIKTVQECMNTFDGLGLEKLVLSKFLSDHVGATVPLLPTFRLGEPKLLDQVSVPIDVVNVATCTSLEVIQDVAAVKRLAERRDLTILYVCPKGTKTMDLCILSKTGVIPIQISLSSLTVHDKPDPNFLKEIDAYTREITTRNSADWKYVFITTAPDPHKTIAQQKEWNGLETDKIRIVDATTWLRRDNV